MDLRQMHPFLIMCCNPLQGRIHLGLPLVQLLKNRPTSFRVLHKINTEKINICII